MKRIMALMLILCMVLSGCALAQEGEIQVTDQLIGMLITVDYFLGEEPDIYEDLPIWNSESSGMEDPLHYQSNLGARLYAQLVPEEYEVDGEIHTTMRYVFPEGTGIPHMTFLVLKKGDQENYWSYVDGPEICGGHRGIHVVDEKTNIEVAGTIFVDARATDLVLHLNPVYQTPEGEVYALGTFPAGYHAVSKSGCPQTISQTLETTIGEETVLSGGSVTLNIQTVTLPERYVILEMDEHNQSVCSAAYAPEEMPREYTPKSETAYLILETHGEDGITRTVYSPDDESACIENYHPGDWGILIRGYTSIKWEGSE